MKISELARANTKAYRRYYILIVASALIMTAVITGSLSTGDSVRNTLTERVKQRLGNTESVIFSKNSFFSDDLARPFGRPVLLVNGFVSFNGRNIPVMVWGLDSILGAQINRTLAEEIRQTGGEIVLRLPATGLAPSGSLFVTKNYTTSARFSVTAIKETKDGGDISLKNEQITPCNVFVNRKELASLLKIDGKINLVLSPKYITEDDLAKVWTPLTSGISVENNTVRSDRIFLQKEVVDEICSVTPDKTLNVNRIFAYLANSLSHGSDTVPYSFVAATDVYGSLTLAHDDIILSDYTAKRLNAAKGDTVGMTFFLSKDLKTLYEKEIRLIVAAIAPVEALRTDSAFSADFPGLSDVENCTDWDSDLPIDMSRIGKTDEDYWDAYRTTPKALVPYSALAPLWSNAYGCATALQSLSGTPDLSHLNCSMTGINIVRPREAGFDAAKGSIDFAMLFLALGFFIIIAAVLLLLTPLAEMLFSRRNEFALLAALGFTRKRIIHILWQESVRVAVIASIAGVVAGLFYNILILLLLNTLWNGAVHISNIGFYINVSTALCGFAAGLALVLLVLRISLTKAANNSFRPIKLRSKPSNTFSINGLIRADLHLNRKRIMLSFAALASGALIVFSTGLNRRGFEDSEQLKTGTGGFNLWLETSVPIFHNMNTLEGRKKLALTDLPETTRFLQLLRYSADDASCLNLNKVSQPSVLCVDFKELKNSAFSIKNCFFPDNNEVFKGSSDSVYYALIDETTLLWGLQKKLGDTVYYTDSKGATVKLLLAATLHNSVFQGNILIDRGAFSKIWGDISGSEIALISTDNSNADNVKALTERALSEYGARVTAAAARLQEFNSVTDTYLSIFLALGGLGLIIGIACFIIVVRKDLASKTEQISLLRSLGFTDIRITSLLTSENRFIPVGAITVGFLLSLLAVIDGLTNVSDTVWLTTVIFALLLIAGAWFFVERIVNRSLRF